MADFLTLDQIPLNGRVVILRADLNVPTHNGNVTDATRLERLQPTLRDLAKAEAKVVIISHFGRPKGAPQPDCSLRPVAAELSRILKKPVAFADDCIGPVAEAAVKALLPGQILVLENTRFHPGEEANDDAYAKSLAALGNLYVNDAFSTAHRAHASTEGIAHHLMSCAGRLMQAELEALDRALGHPTKPVAAIVGGSKISTKLDLLNNLVGKVDMLVLGGGMANTFLAAKGINVGKSLCETNMLDTAKQIMATAEQRGCHIMLPEDVVIASELKPNVSTSTVSIRAVPDDQMIFDIGTASTKAIKEALTMCKTIVWNGPLGAFETPPFDHATNEIAIAVADLTKRGVVISIAGGGDTAAALETAGVTNGFTYLSTAGGAFLEWMEGKSLPGVAALKLSLPKVKVGKVIM